MDEDVFIKCKLPQIIPVYFCQVYEGISKREICASSASYQKQASETYLLARRGI